ncbi:MAG TPA: ClpXP protease specificity-enhancing factor [Ideonella sp.]|uniref:ClpXP protease specificity-enhancing factor n=1 Tax=Ideonella sp. TaxID=1929293 RepID=UPI002E34BC77|nr:ClpXP protease specificity-enhancing factor [Ideonella sp.]HEX5683617.1 ClpXP protease specificity-enhancing factor [Ideonella sp.]
MTATPPTPPSAPDNQGTSTRPYLVRALHDWCTDNGFTPYLAVFVDSSVQVPTEYVKNNEIVLNVGFEATSGLKLGNDFIEFKARFGGVAREIVVPVDHVVAIYARENGQGMAFPMPSNAPEEASAGTPLAPDSGGTGAERPIRGLRLARTETPSEPPPAPPAPSADATDGDEPPPPPRPALKRVK